MKVYRWIHIVDAETEPGKKTKIWHVLAKATGGLLGEIRWFSIWRRYGFFPESGTVFEQDCLWDIADFCAQSTADHKEGWKKTRAGSGQVKSVTQESGK